MSSMQCVLDRHLCLACWARWGHDPLIITKPPIVPSSMLNHTTLCQTRRTATKRFVSLGFSLGHRANAARFTTLLVEMLHAVLWKAKSFLQNRRNLTIPSASFHLKRRFSRGADDDLSCELVSALKPSAAKVHIKTRSTHTENKNIGNELAGLRDLTLIHAA